MEIARGMGMATIPEPEKRIGAIYENLTALVLSGKSSGHEAAVNADMEWLAPFVSWLLERMKADIVGEPERKDGLSFDQKLQLIEFADKHKHLLREEPQEAWAEQTVNKLLALMARIP